MIVQLAFDLAAKNDTVSHLSFSTDGATKSAMISFLAPGSLAKTETVSVLPATCPLCRGHLVDDVCQKCGMEVEL